MKKSDSMPDCLTKCFITYSAMVERQILPWQMNNTFIIVKTPCIFGIS